MENEKKIDWDSVKAKWMFQGYTAKQMAEEFDIPLSTVYSKIKKWIFDGSVPTSEIPDKKVSLRDMAFSEIWGKLDDYQLSEQEKVFVLSYAHSNDPHEALKEAQMYSNSKSENSMTITHLLGKQRLKLAVAHIRNLILNRYNLEADDVLVEYAKILKSNMGDFVSDFGYKEVEVKTRRGTFTKEVPYIKLKNIKDVDLSLVKSMKIGQSGDVQIELYDKKLALEFFTKYLNMIDGNSNATNDNKLAQGLLTLVDIMKNK
ncbi:MAG: terminase small subunit [Peptostreptococcaceae bacterium]